MLHVRRWALSSYSGRWLHSQRKPVTAAMEKFISDENEKFSNFSSRTKKLQSQLHAEAVNMLIPEGMSPPELNKGHFYFQRYDEAGQVRFCRVPADSAGKIMDIEKESPLEEEILSLSDIARRFSTNNFVDVSAAKLSIDSATLGFVCDTRGDEKWTLRFRDLLRKNFIENLKFDFVRNFEWIDNPLIPGQYLYFTEMDPVTLRSVRVVRAEIDTSAVGRVVSRETVWELPASDSTSYVDLFKSKDGKCVFMSSSSKTRSEVYVVSADDPKATPSQVAAPQDGVEYFCEHRENFIYVVSNREFLNFALYRAPASSPNELSLVYHSPDMTIADMDMFRKGLVLYGHGFEGQPAVEVMRFKNCVDADTVPEEASDYDAFGVADTVKIPFKGSYAVGKIEIGVNGDFDADVARFTFRNPKNPGTCLQFRFRDRKLEAVKSREFQRHGGVDAIIDRVGVPSADGEVEIPLTVVIPENIDPVNSPCLVHVYGAYGQVLEPDFSPAVVSLLKRGWIVAFAHVRGGGERGPEWHKAGSKMNRWKSVVDLEACCQWLIAERFTSPGKLCAVGASAGGVVLGSALNVFGKSLIGGAAILRVPFVDLYETLKDPSLPLSSHEKDEWGDVNDGIDAAFIRSISPADNIVTDTSEWYPPLLVTSAEDDARVPFQGVVKYAQLLREVVPDSDRLIVKTSRAGEGGHFGSASSAGNYEDTCAELAFLIENVH